MLVLDTSITRGFVEALETLAPSQESKVLHFVVELLKNATAYEARIHSLNEQLEALIVQLELMGGQKEQPETMDEESAYAETDEEDEENGED